MDKLKVDIAIIGSGPAGQKAAIQAAKLGRKVVVLERYNEPGGSCLFSGTIPSKSLREAIIDLTRFHERYFYGKEMERPDVTIKDLNYRLHRVTDEEKNMIYRQFKKNGIHLIQGTASFIDPHTLHLEDEEYQMVIEIRAKKVIIATGSRPRNPPEVPFDGQVILDSTTLLNIKKVPKSMIVLGGGIIGAEYASYFAALGTKISIVDKRGNILPMLDKEIGLHLQTALTDIGLTFYGNRKPIEIKKIDGRAYVKCDDGTELTADILLFALGRIGCIESLQIEKAGLTLNEYGYISVNGMFQTENSDVYAVGDVIGGPSLASTSMEQGRLAARHACEVEVHEFPSYYPVGIYTIPEISSCGYTERDVKELGYDYEVGRAYYYEIARSHIAGSGSGIGMFKIIFQRDTLEILGVHVIGRNAAEVIHIGQMAITTNTKLDFFVSQIFNYPTYAEGYRVAALNGINKVQHRR